MKQVRISRRFVGHIQSRLSDTKAPTQITNPMSPRIQHRKRERQDTRHIKRAHVETSRRPGAAPNTAAHTTHTAWGSKRPLPKAGKPLHHDHLHEAPRRRDTDELASRTVRRIQPYLFFVSTTLLFVGLSACDGDDSSSDNGSSSGETGDTSGGSDNEACDQYESYIAECLGEAQGDVLRQECDAAYTDGEPKGMTCTDALDAFFICISMRTCDQVTELEPCVEEDQMVDAACD